MFTQLIAQWLAEIEAAFCQVANPQPEKKFPDHKLLRKIVCNVTDFGVRKVFVVDYKLNNSDNITISEHFWVHQGKIVFKIAEKIIDRTPNLIDQ